MRSKEILEEFKTFEFAFPENCIMRFIERRLIKKSLLEIDGVIEIKDSGSCIRINTFQLSEDNFLRISERLSRFECRGRHTLRNELGSREQFRQRLIFKGMPECPF